MTFKVALVSGEVFDKSFSICEMQLKFDTFNGIDSAHTKISSQSDGTLFVWLLEFRVHGLREIPFFLPRKCFPLGNFSPQENFFFAFLFFSTQRWVWFDSFSWSWLFFSVVLQIVPIETVLEHSLFEPLGSRSSILRSLALSVYAQNQRKVPPRMAPKMLTGFGPGTGFKKWLEDRKAMDLSASYAFTPPYILSSGRERKMELMDIDHKNRVTTLMVAYCLSEDQKWMLVSCTDTRGEILESQVINVFLSNRYVFLSNRYVFLSNRYESVVKSVWIRCLIGMNSLSSLNHSPSSHNALQKNSQKYLENFGFFPRLNPVPSKALELKRCLSWNSGKPYGAKRAQ